MIQILPSNPSTRFINETENFPFMVEISITRNELPQKVSIKSRAQKAHRKIPVLFESKAILNHVN